MENKNEGSESSLMIFPVSSPSSMTTFATCLHIFRWTVRDLPPSHRPQAVWKDFSRVPLKYGCRGKRKMKCLEIIPLNSLNCLQIKPVLTKMRSVVEHALNFAALQEMFTMQPLARARAVEWRAHGGQKCRFTFWIGVEDAGWIHVSPTFTLSRFAVTAFCFSRAPAFDLESF